MQLTVAGHLKDHLICNMFICLARISSSIIYQVNMNLEECQKSDQYLQRAQIRGLNI